MRRAARWVLGAALVLAVLGGCGERYHSPKTAPTQAQDGAADARGVLAARAAAAKDRRYSATYTLTAGAGQPARTVTVTLASDGSWKVDIPGGALSGNLDISVVSVPSGVFQCTLTGVLTCAKLAEPGGVVPGQYDPKVQRPFTDWLTAMVDRKAGLNVAGAQPPEGATGDCFSVEPNTASVPAGVDSGTYCFEPDGAVTAVRATFGLLVRTGPAGAAVPTVALPGPIVAAPPALIVAKP